MDKLKMQSNNIADENFNKLAELFPNVVTETLDNNGNIVRAIDKDLLEQEINNKVISGKDERYQFTWPEKRKSILLANSPISETLRPCLEESLGKDGTPGKFDSENLYIEGDNLDVLKLLQQTYVNQIKMIYIDPPYNTGNDFIYNDNFEENISDYLNKSGQFDERGNKLIQNTESNGKFHTDWLNMMYPRLKLARNLLKKEGVIFISIDDNEVENLKKICDEIFGPSNFLGTFVINSTPNARDYGHIGKMHEYCLFYAKNSALAKTNMLPEKDKKFKYKDEIGGFNIHPLYNSNEAFTNINRPNLFYPFYLYLDEPIDDCFYKIGLEKKDNCVEIFPPKSVKNDIQFVWRWGKEKSIANLNKEIIGYKDKSGDFRIVQKMRHTEKIIRSLLTDTKYSSRRGTAEVEELFNSKYFSFPKPISLIKDFINVGSSDNDIVLDFFSGSATTAHAILELNAEENKKRKFIMVQLPEQIPEDSEAYKAGFKNICEIGKARIQKASQAIKEKTFHNSDNIDFGYRLFKIDTSNMKEIFYNPKDFMQIDFDGIINNIKEDRTSEDLLIQAMLELAIPLSSKISTIKINNKNVYSIDDNYLLACFDNNINSDLITNIAKMKPSYFITRDTSIENDSVATNFDQIFKTYSPDTVRKVL